MDQESEVKPDPRRALPPVSRLLAWLAERAPDLPEWTRKAAVRRVLAEARGDLGGSAAAAAKPDALADRALLRAAELARPRPGPVVNATGVVLHTNLGRAPLAEGAARAAALAASHYSDLELELLSGRRGSRLEAVREMLALLSGAEAALVVNNNAAALLLVANTFAREREVVVSRGELVEIGGSFRVPEILERSGARLVEVGTTNRTHAADYAEVMGPRTALLLKVHRSNFEQRGFVAEVELPDLARVGREHHLPVVEDLGSGTLVDLRERGLPEESFAPARLGLGADLVCFSGDKLLGGPQAGIVLGDRESVDALGRNPLARALRLDKQSLASLDWTLRALLEGREAEIPVLARLLEPVERVEARARALLEQLRPVVAEGVLLSIEPTRAPVGGGSVPGMELESFAVAVWAPEGPDALAAALRAAPLPVLGRVQRDALYLDARTLLPGEEEAVAQALLGAWQAVLRAP